MDAAIISIITSLIISGITFIFGLKSGKNQADREKLQNLYKEMYVGIRDVRKALSEDQPKKYENYESKTTGYRTQYLPPVTKIFYEGNNVFLNKKIAESSLDLERRCMTYGDMFSKTSENVHKIILNNLDLFAEGYKFEPLGHQKDEKRKIVTANPQKINSCVLLSYGSFLTEAGREHVIKLLSDSEKGVSFEKVDRGTILLTTTIYPGGLKVPCTEFVDCIMEQINPKQEQLKSQKEKLVKECDRKIKKLARRSKEPISFFETIFGAVADIFH